MLRPDDLLERRVIQLTDGRYLVLTLRELYEVKESAPHRLVKVGDDWCIKL